MRCRGIIGIATSVTLGYRVLAGHTLNLTSPENGAMGIARLGSNSPIELLAYFHIHLSQTISLDLGNPLNGA